VDECEERTDPAIGAERRCYYRRANRRLARIGRSLFSSRDSHESHGNARRRDRRNRDREYLSGAGGRGGPLARIAAVSSIVVFAGILATRPMLSVLASALGIVFPVALLVFMKVRGAPLRAA
jgi:hypothetical protein